MKALSPISDIALPVVTTAADSAIELRTSDLLTIELMGASYPFRNLKHLLGAADISKAGERIAGLAATDEVEREAARKLLSGLTLQQLYDMPLTDNRGRIDDIMRVNYDIDPEKFCHVHRACLSCACRAQALF